VNLSRFASLFVTLLTRASTLGAHSHPGVARVGCHNLSAFSFLVKSDGPALPLCFASQRVFEVRVGGDCFLWTTKRVFVS